MNNPGYTTMEEHMKTCPGCSMCRFDDPADYGYGTVDKAAENAKNAVASKHWPDAECYCRMCAPLGEAAQRRLNEALKTKLAQAGDQFVKVTPGDYFELRRLWLARLDSARQVGDIGPDPSAPPPIPEPPLHRRLGRFVVSNSLLREDHALAVLIFADKLIVRAEQRFDTDGIDYVAYGREFDVVQPGMMAPQYDIKFHLESHGGGELTRRVSFKKS